MDWYETESLSEGITRIRETYVASWLRCNMWHVRGRDRDLLVDSGMGLSPLKSEVAQLTEKPVVCVASHAHFDHIGANHEFDVRLGHAAEADIHANPTRAATATAGFIRAETISALPRVGYDILDYQITPAPLTGYLDEGDTLDLGDRVLRVLHLPGHSPGSIALYEERSRILFSGDTVYDGELYDTVYHSDREHYRESLQRLLSLDVSVVYGGHDEPFDARRLRTIVQSYLDGGQRLADPAAWIDRQVRAD